MENVEIAQVLNEYCGTLHTHRTWTDGADTLEAMARACQELGYEYWAMTDHRKSTRVAGGLTATDLKKHWKEIKIRGKD